MRNLGFVGVALAFLAIGCPGPKPAATPDPSKSDVTVDRAAGVVADGSDRATVTVTVHDTAGAPVKGAQVTVAASGTGNTLGAAAPTDDNGVTTVTLASTVAEAKTLSATLSQGPIPKSPQVAFVAGAVSPSASSVAVAPGTAMADGLATVTITVTARDANNNPVVGKSVVLAASGSQNTLLQPAATDARGVAASTLASTKAESKAITANVGGVALVQQQVVQFTPGDVAQLAFLVPPSNAAAGSAITPAVQVAVQDAHGNRVTSAATSITVALGSHPAGSTLSGARTVAATNGVAAFADLSIDRTGAGYTLAASATGLTPATSPAFDITVGAASKLVFSVQPPASAQAGVAISPALQVQLQDASGNVVTGATAQVTLALMGGATGATLGGQSQVGTTSGVATFAGLTVDKPGTGYTLVATAPGFTGATTFTFSVTAGPASRLAFTVQPGNGAAGTALSPAVQVAIQDALGNTVTGDTRAITLSLGSNPGGATLSGFPTVNAVGGVATFSNLLLDKVGTGYSLLAASAGLASTISNAFNLAAGAPAKLVFTVAPSNATAGAPVSPAVQVSIQDVASNPVTTASNTVTLALGSAPGATLSGTTSVAAVNGVATFANLLVDKAGSGYTLTASGAGLASTTSGAFNVAAGAPSKLAFTVAPSNATSGAPLTPAVRVAIQDAFGNVVLTASNTVALSLDNAAGATLSGTTSAAAVNGIATFANLSVDKAATGYTLTASSGALASATSSGFDVSAGTAAKLAFTAQPPASSAAGAAFPQPVKVTVQDAAGNTVTGATNAITLALTNAAGATLAGTTTVNAVGGIASFPALSVNKAGSGYSLSATATGLSPATSASFSITPGAAVKLAFLVQPSNGSTGTALTPAVQVAIQDSLGNTVTTSSASVSVALGANPPGGALTGTTTLAASSGVATFSNLSIDKPGNGYALVAAAAGLASATSNPFNLALGPITGTRVVHHLTDTGQVDEVVDLTADPIGAYVLNDGGFAFYPGSGTDAGTFTIPNVPLQSYYLRYRTDFIQTATRSIDLGSYRDGRPNTQTADAGTTLAMSFTGMTPWIADDGNGYPDDLQMFSSNAGFWAAGLPYFDTTFNTPQDGDTSIIETMDYSQAQASYGPLALPNAALGDKTVFTHLSRRSAGGGDPDAGIPPNTYVALTDVLSTSTLTVADGADAGPVTGAFTHVAQNQSYAINWKLDEATPNSFGSYRLSVHPNARASFAYFIIDGVAGGGAHGQSSSTPDLVLLDTLLGAQPDQAFTFTYGNPFPTLTQFATAQVGFTNRYTLPKPGGGTASVSATGYVYAQDLASNLQVNPLQPQLGTVQNPAINGTSAFVNQTIGATPTISWTPPAVGTPRYYTLRFRELYVDGSGFARRSAYLGRVMTTGTSVQVPPGILQSGKNYMVVISAVNTPVTLSAMPYDSKFPYHSTDVLSGLLTVP